MSLPIDVLRERLPAELERRPVVISSPTGSGKSTQVPQWCADREEGAVLVVEPRRVACRSLAERVAELRGVALGTDVGYRVRGEQRVSAATSILFATPGMVLRRFDEVEHFHTVVLDEFHERRLDVDLLLALLHRHHQGRLAVMSATLDAEKLTGYLEGAHLRAEGRTHPVEVRYVPAGALLPDVRGLDDRAVAALDAVCDVPGDVLVFLPGKAEIAAVAERLGGRGDLCVLPLHGGLSLEEQSRVFRASERRKVVLATNVAETSVTVPGIGVVIDSGLVRRTRYHRGRGFLALVPVARDSAEQRTGRAGRTGPGVCLRLWDQAAKLEHSTPPEMHRESLVPLVLAAAACGERVEGLEWLDPPKDHALESAHVELRALGAIDPTGALTPCGRELFGLPLDPHLGRLLVEARARDTLEDAVDLVAALGTGRSFFLPGARPPDEEDDLRSAGCDATALVRAVRQGDPRRHRLSRHALVEARSDARRLRRAMGLPERPDPDRPVDREALARTALAADPRCVHVARRRKRDVGWSNGGTEIELASGSALAGREGIEAVAVLDSRALVDRRAGTRVIATCGIPLPLRWLVEAGLGRDRLAGVEREGDTLVARVERVYARRVLEVREEEPTGATAREAIRDLFVRGSLFPKTLETTRERLGAASLAAELAASTLDLGIDLSGHDVAPPSLEEWVLARLEELGVEGGSDLALLEPTDLVPPDLPFEVRSVLDREFPRELDLGDSAYAVDYDLRRRQVLLRLIRGHRHRPPPRSYLPRFHGFRVCIEAGGSMHIVR